MYEKLKILLSSKRKFYKFENWDKIEVIKTEKNKIHIRNIEGYKWIVLYINLMKEKWYKINRLYSDNIGDLLFYTYKIVPD